MESWTAECGCTCCASRKLRGRFVPTYSTIQNTVSIINEHTKSILYSLEHIQQCRRAYGDIISKTWNSKTPAQRKSALKAACADLPPGHRPEYEHQQNDVGDSSGNPVASPQALDTPQLNLDDLSLDGVLLALLRSRSDTHPFEFIISDLDNAGVSSENHVTMKELDEWRNVFCDTSYGKFALASKLEKDDSEHLGLHPLAAMYALRTQKRIMLFLYDICRVLLKEHGLDTTNEDLKSRPDCAPYADLALGNGLSATPRASALLAETQLPCSMSTAELLALAEGEMSEARDHVLSLVGDSSYFVQHLRNQEAHIPQVSGYLESLRKMYATQEPNAQITAVLDGKNKAFAYLMTGHACCFIVMDAFRVLLLWTHIWKWAVELSGEKYHGETCRSAHAKYPQDVEKALCNIQHLLRALSKINCEQLAWAFPASSKMRKFFNAGEVLQSTPDAAPHYLNMRTLSPTFGAKDKDAKWAYHTIKMLAESEPGMVGYRNTMGEAVHLLGSKRGASSFVSSFLKERIAQIISSGQLHEEFRYMWPASAMWEEYDDDARIATGKLVHDLKAFCKIAERVCTAATFRSNDLYCPEAEPDSRNVRDRKCQAEEKISGFWHSLSEAWDASDAIQGSVLELLQDTFAMCQDPRQTEPWETETATSTRELSKLAVDDSTSTSLATLLSQKPRAKPKTRSLIAAAQDVRDEHDAQEEAAPLILSLEAATYRTIDVIFNKSGGMQPGELSWTDIQSLMCAIGFDAVVTRNGSSVCFTPSPAGIQGIVWTRSISLHSPHPKPGYVKAQIYRLRGRLQRAFDLSKDSFTLRE